MESDWLVKSFKVEKKIADYLGVDPDLVQAFLFGVDFSGLNIYQSEVDTLFTQALRRKGCKTIPEREGFGEMEFGDIFTDSEVFEFLIEQGVITLEEQFLFM